MQNYDVALKLLLQQSARGLIRELAGAPVTKWLDVELPKTQNPRADLLGEMVDGGLIHIELQTGNDAAMPLRMAEYCLGIYRLFGRFPLQVLLYLGEAPLRMSGELMGPRLSFQYRVTDVRELDGERLLESPDLGDNLIAILARLRDHRSAVRRIIERLAELGGTERQIAITQLLILAGLRSLEEVVENEVQDMPLHIDILENKVLGREFKKAQEKGRQEGLREGLQEGRQEGRQEGLQEGRQEGRQEGELKLVEALIQRRLGSIPLWAKDRLASRSASELEHIFNRLLDGVSLEDLLK
jgi:predicted transposase YdaD